jgi:squalene synthase HpnC
VSLFAITSQLCPNRRVAGRGLAGGTGRGGLDEQEAADLATPTADTADTAGTAGTPGIAVASQVSLAVAAKAAAENFPVALRVLPRSYRTHLTALYGFARLTDDIGDEPLPGMPPDATEAEVTKTRLALLDDLQADVAKIYDGEGQEPELDAIRALKITVDQCKIPREPLDDLIEANRQDQLVTRYETFEELTRYCELSANPVGRVVLHIVTEPTPERIRMSDSICTALQLIEHSQDVAEDLANGRIYLPREHRDAFGVTEADLARPTATENVRKLLKYEADLAEKLLDEGTPLIGTLRGAARIAIAGYVAGGRAALKAIRDSGYDVLRSTPKPGKADTIRAMARCYVKGR